LPGAPLGAPDAPRATDVLPADGPAPRREADWIDRLADRVAALWVGADRPPLAAPAPTAPVRVISPTADPLLGLDWN
ncbi:MAG: hypothetical protein ACKODX_14475, partial [Gemmata sp.]